MKQAAFNFLSTFLAIALAGMGLIFLHEKHTEEREMKKEHAQMLAQMLKTSAIYAEYAKEKTILEPEIHDNMPADVLALVPIVRLTRVKDVTAKAYAIAGNYQAYSDFAITIDGYERWCARMDDALNQLRSASKR